MACDLLGAYVHALYRSRLMACASHNRMVRSRVSPFVYGMVGILVRICSKGIGIKPSMVRCAGHILVPPWTGQFIAEDLLSTGSCVMIAVGVLLWSSFARACIISFCGTMHTPSSSVMSCHLAATGIFQSSCRRKTGSMLLFFRVFLVV